MIQKELLWQDTASIDSLSNALRADKVVLMTSDTVLGLCAPLTNVGFQALNRIKGREKKPYLIMIADKQQLNAYCPLPLSPAIEKLITHCWPGPLTLILPAKEGIDSFLTHTGTSIAIRIPNHAPLLTLLQRVGGLFSTSANIAGKPVPATLDQVDSTILDHIEVIVTDDTANTVPSTILDCTGDQVKLVREGAYPLALIERLCGPL